MPASAGARGGPPRSLKARALQWLAQREQSRAELRRKLLRSLRDDARRAELAEVARRSAEVAAPSGAEPDPEGGGDSGDAADSGDGARRVDEVLDWLQAHGYLSEERFVESRVHARAERYGNLRIRRELQQHQLALTDEQAHALQSTEAARAGAVLARRFAAAPRDATEKARQIRFLTSRGFSPDAVRAALRAAGATADHALE
jgi:regulatory protein